jgi:Cu-Zn family superoxide dismutase
MRLTRFRIAMTDLVIVVFLLVLTAGPNRAQGTTGKVIAAAPKVVIRNAQGQVVGTATITEQTLLLGQQFEATLQIKLDLKALPPGEHATFIHEHATCEAPGFTSAGGHFNPTKAFGATVNGYTLGDIGNFTVTANGKAKAMVGTPGLYGRIQFGLANGAPSVTLSQPSSILGLIRQNGGSSLVIDAQPYDRKSDPEGSSREHIACGVIQP